MFRNTRGSSGIGALVAVAVIIASYLTTAGLMWKSYRDGGATEADAARCELVCAHAGQPETPSKGG